MATPPKKPSVPAVKDDAGLMKKFSGAIQIQNYISLLERKIWNLLLFNAFRNLSEHDEFQIPISVIRREMGWENNNVKLLMQALETLSTTPVRWGLVDETLPDGIGELGVSALLTHGVYNNGVVSYGFSKRLIPFLADPKVFGTINLRLSSRLKSKYSLSLYENAMLYIDPVQGGGKSEYLDIETMYELLGASREKKLRDFKRDCLDLAVKEVNDKTNISVDVDYKRSGKGRGGQIHGMRLVVSLKSQPDFDLPPNQDIQLDQAMIEKMTVIGVAKGVALQLAAQYDTQYLNEKFAVLKASKTVKSQAKFFVSAVKNDWKADDTQEEIPLVPAQAPQSRGSWVEEEDREAPEILWYRGLDELEQERVVLAFTNASTLTEREMTMLEKNGPEDPFVVVKFMTFVRGKRSSLSREVKKT